MITAAPLSRRAAAADQDDAADDQHGRDAFLPGQLVLSDPNAHDGRDDGLEVGVHADQRRTDAFLAVGDQEVGDEGCEEDEIGDFPSHEGGDRGEIRCEKAFCGN